MTRNQPSKSCAESWFETRLCRTIFILWIESKVLLTLKYRLSADRQSSITFVASCRIRGSQIGKGVAGRAEQVAGRVSFESRELKVDEAVDWFRCFDLLIQVLDRKSRNNAIKLPHWSFNLLHH